MCFVTKRCSSYANVHSGYTQQSTHKTCQRINIGIRHQQSPRKICCAAAAFCTSPAGRLYLEGVPAVRTPRVCATGMVITRASEGPKRPFSPFPLIPEEPQR